MFTIHIRLVQPLHLLLLDTIGAGLRCPIRNDAHLLIFDRKSTKTPRIQELISNIDHHVKLFPITTSRMQLSLPCHVLCQTSHSDKHVGTIFNPEGPFVSYDIELSMNLAVRSCRARHQNIIQDRSTTQAVSLRLARSFIVAISTHFRNT